MSYWLYRFGAYEFPNYASSHQLDVESKDYSIELADGTYYDQFNPNQRLPIKGGTVSFSAMYGACDATDLHNTHVALRKLVGTRNQLIRIREYDENYQYVNARCTKISINRKEGEDAFKFHYDLTFVIDEGIWTDVAVIVWYLDETPPETLDSGLSLDEGGVTEAITGNSTNFTIDVTDSDIEIYDMKVSLIVNSGTLSTPLLTNTDNNYAFAWNNSMSAGQELVIDTSKKSVTLNGLDSYSYFSYGGAQMEWMKLDLGTNNMNFSCAISGTATLKISWGDKYL